MSQNKSLSRCLTLVLLLSALVIQMTLAVDTDCEADVGRPPIIDIGALKNPRADAADRGKVIDEIVEACKKWGFFQIANHTLDLKLLANAREMMKAFFHLPLDEKLKVKRTQNNSRGFANDELTKQKRDWKEIFDYGGPSEDVLDAKILDGHNQWPTLEGFKDTLQAYYAENAKLAELIMDAISEGLNIEKSFFREAFSRHTSFARLNYYPPLTDHDGLGISRHTDAGALTILWQDGPGLEVYSGTKEDKNDGTWVPVDPSSLDILTVNIGDMLHVWTGGICPAPEHRVKANRDKERYSIPFFYNPNYEVTMQPISSLKGPQKYRPFTWGRFRMARFAGDYADVGTETQIEDYEVT